MTDFERARRLMVDNQLRTAAVTDRRVLAAMGEVPRERFVTGSRHELAYIDEPQPVSGTRRLGAPAPFARLIQLAAIEHGERVLDLGCANGYSAAVLSRLAAEVVAVEEDAGLAAAARSNLAALAMGNVIVLEGPLWSASRGKGSFDVIVLEGTVEDVPGAVLAQLKPEGRLVALVAQQGRPAVAHLFAKSGKGIASSPAFDARLPSLAKDTDRGFVF